MNEEGLFNDFPKVSAKAWKQKIQYDLKGADYNKTLVWESPEGIKVKPFYHAEDIEDNPLEESVFPATWHIGQEIYAGKASPANKKALNALQRGAESIILTVPSQDIAIQELLSKIDLQTTPFYFNFQFLSLDYTRKLIPIVAEKKMDIHLNVDIIGHLARSGNWYFNLEKDHALVQDILELNQKHSLGVDVSLYQNAGANKVQQLAYAMAHANEYLHHFYGDPLKSITFKVAIGSNYFFEIAKLKALRRLWSTLTGAYGIPVECHILAYPTKRNKTLYDYNVNMLRTTTECMSAILGGADTICNMPYDGLYHKANDFGERMARNQLLVLKNESHFNENNNPAKGAYYIEALTDQLAEKALGLFKDIEASGGFLKQLKEGVVQKKIRESAMKEQEKFNTGEEVLIGTNKYQNEKDQMKGDLECYPFVKTNTRKTLIEPIIEKRLAEAMEQKRLKDE